MQRYSTTYDATAFPGALHGGVVTAEGLRRSISRPSEIITGGQIPTGADVVRINNPPEYITHEAVAQPAAPAPQYYQHHQPGCCETISPCCLPGDVYNGASNAVYTGAAGLHAGATGLVNGAANTATGAYHGVRRACPWWLWLIIGIIGFILLAGIIWGLLVAFSPVFSSAWKGTKNLASGAWEGAKNVGGHIGRGAKSVADATGDAAGAAWDGAKNIGGHIGRGAKTVVDATGNAAGAAWEGAKNVGGHIGEGAKNAASGIGSGIKTVADATGDVAGAAWDGTKKVGQSVFEGGRSVGEGVGNALSHEETQGLRSHNYFGKPLSRPSGKSRYHHLRNFHYNELY